MFKKLLAAIAIITTSSTLACAASAPYLGASLGVMNTTPNDNTFRGMPFTVSGGFGGVVNQNIYLGGELVGVVGTSTLDSNGPQNVKTTYGYGLSFIPGMMLSDHTMAYIRASILKSHFSRLDKTATGNQLGIGMQTSVTQNWDVRGEYDYTTYHKFLGISPKADLFNLGLVYKFA